MRVLVVLCLLTATAAAQSPPSKTLERAIKLYDRQDFYSATIELTKVVDGETGDDKPNLERAQFFLGKALYQLGYYVPSLAELTKIANDPSHTYNTATLKWLVALTNVLDPDLVPILAYPIETADDPALASVRSQIIYLWGRAKLRHGDTKSAATAFGKLAPGSEYGDLAAIGLALVGADDKAALAALKSVVQTSNAYALAQLATARIHRRAKRWEDAIAAASSAKASWELELARLGSKGESLGSLEALVESPVSLDGAEPGSLQAFATCDDRSDALAAARDPSVVRELDMLAKISDDNSEVWEQHRKVLAKLSKRTQAIVQIALSGPSLQRPIALVDELQRELDLLRNADKAWQTTRIASEVLQELTVEEAVAEADAGKLLRGRFERLARDAHAIAANKTKLPCL